MSPILANPLIKPDPAAIVSARDYFIDCSRSARTGAQQVTGLIAMSIDGNRYADARYKSVTAFFNVDKVAKEITIAERGGAT
jgi:pullulanase